MAGVWMDRLEEGMVDGGVDMWEDGMMGGGRKEWWMLGWTGE